MAFATRVDLRLAQDVWDDVVDSRADLKSAQTSQPQTITLEMKGIREEYRRRCVFRLKHLVKK